MAKEGWMISSVACVVFYSILNSIVVVAFVSSVGIRNMNSKDGMSMEEMRKLIEKWVISLLLLTRLLVTCVLCSLRLQSMLICTAKR